MCFVFRRGKPVRIFFENVAEIIGAGKSNRLGNLIDGNVLRLQNVLGAVNPILVQVLDGRNPKVADKQLIQILEGNMNVRGNVGARNLPEIVFPNIVDRALHIFVADPFSCVSRGKVVIRMERKYAVENRQKIVIIVAFKGAFVPIQKLENGRKSVVVRNFKNPRMGGESRRRKMLGNVLSRNHNPELFPFGQFLVPVHLEVLRPGRQQKAGRSLNGDSHCGSFSRNQKMDHVNVAVHVEVVAVRQSAVSDGDYGKFFVEFGVFGFQNGRSERLIIRF